MASAQSPNPYIYSQAEQAKHYKLYIFLTPVMFCIILFMLLYLFYLKHKASASSPLPTFTRAPSLSSFVIPVSSLSYMYVCIYMLFIYCVYVSLVCMPCRRICNVPSDIGVIGSFLKMKSFLTMVVKELFIFISYCSY